MPIKPENRGRYPENWPEIRARILARAGNRCEQCRAARRPADGVGRHTAHAAGRKAGPSATWATGVLVCGGVHGL